MAHKFNRFERFTINPPALPEVAELIEFIWYFLKATDGHVIKRSTRVQINPTGRIDDSENYFEVHIKFEENPKLLISGQGGKGFFSLKNEFNTQIQLNCLERNFRESKVKNLIGFSNAEIKNSTDLIKFLKKFFEGI